MHDAATRARSSVGPPSQSTDRTPRSVARCSSAAAGVAPPGRKRWTSTSAPRPASSSRRPRCRPGSAPAPRRTAGSRRARGRGARSSPRSARGRARARPAARAGRRRGGRRSARRAACPGRRGSRPPPSATHAAARCRPDGRGRPSALHGGRPVRRGDHRRRHLRPGAGRPASSPSAATTSARRAAPAPSGTEGQQARASPAAVCGRPQRIVTERRTTTNCPRGRTRDPDRPPAPAPVAMGAAARNRAAAVAPGDHDAPDARGRPARAAGVRRADGHRTGRPRRRGPETRRVARGAVASWRSGRSGVAVTWPRRSVAITRQRWTPSGQRRQRERRRGRLARDPAVDLDGVGQRPQSSKDGVHFSGVRPTLRKLVPLDSRNAPGARSNEAMASERAPAGALHEADGDVAGAVGRGLEAVGGVGRRRGHRRLALRQLHVPARPPVRVLRARGSSGRTTARRSGRRRCRRWRPRAARRRPGRCRAGRAGLKTRSLITAPKDAPVEAVAM